MEACMQLNAIPSYVNALKSGRPAGDVMAEMAVAGVHFIAAVKTVALALDVDIAEATVQVRASKLWQGQFKTLDQSDDPFFQDWVSGAKP
jgi:hypothetical protein